MTAKCAGLVSQLATMKIEDLQYIVTSLADVIKQKQEGKYVETKPGHMQLDLVAYVENQEFELELFTYPRGPTIEEQDAAWTKESHANKYDKQKCYTCDKDTVYDKGYIYRRDCICLTCEVEQFKNGERCQRLIR